MTGHPAFILGNGPMLPEHLERLDGFFTVGVNRILECYAPTVLLWMDPDVVPHIEPLIDTDQTIALAYGDYEAPDWASRLDDLGHPGRQPNCGPITPGGLISVGNSGVSAAVWAWTLGCRPVYLLGMTATYAGENTNFYGVNPKHHGSTLRQLKRALKVLERYPSMREVNYFDIDSTIYYHHPRGRDWYVEHLTACLAGLDTRQRAEATV